MTGPLKWHGGKHYLAKKIIALMPPHTHYVETYAGGLSVLFAKNPVGVSEVVNDLNLELTNFWQVLRDHDAFSEFQALCLATPFSEVDWRNAEPTTISDMTDRAWRFFVRCRQSMSGRMDSFAPLSRTRTRAGMNEQASAWISSVDGLPLVHARMRRVVVLNRPALEVIAQQDGPKTLYYLDPPYLHSTRATTGEYLHEMTERDHKRLLSRIAGIEGKFILSGYDSELYRHYEKRYGWRRVVFDLPNNSASGKKKRRMTEVVWLNY